MLNFNRSLAALAVVAALAAGLTAPALGQTSWIQTACVPTSWHLNDVCFTTPQRGFIVGNNLVRLRTEDGGATWIKDHEGPPGHDPWYGIRFHEDGLHGYIHGNGGMRTVDGGVTWLEMPTLPLGSWWRIDFASSPETAYFGANGAIAFTADAGATWEIRSGYPHCPIIESMDFVTDDLGLVTGRRIEPYDEGMYRTTDGGRTWTRVFESVAREVRWLSPTVAEASTYDGIIRSEDAGLTWQLVGSATFPPGTADYADLGEGLLVAVTGLGEILRSNNAGFTWFRVSPPLAELGDETWAITLTPGRVLWVVGKYGFILRSDDEGFTWTQASSGMGLNARDMEMLSDTMGMAVGGHGYLWQTTDSGRRWTVRKLIETPLAFGREEGLAAIDIVDEIFAVAAGAGGTMFRTFNGGVTWDNIGYPLLDGSLNITDVCFLDYNNGWILTGQGLFRTTSGGAVWDPIPGVHGRTMHFADALHGWILGGNTVRRTVDGGETWLTSGLPGEPLVIESMTWASATTGWVVGRFGYCARTTNGGATWQLQSLGAGNSLLDAAALSPTELWGVGFDDQYNNISMRSVNGGASWTRQVHSTYDSNTLEVIRRRPDGGLHIAGFFGRMLVDRFPRDCTADWDASGALNSGDISAFLTSWLASVSTPDLLADFNADGVVNSGDISAFLTAWLDALATGC